MTDLITKGVTTLKQLNRECLKIDLTQVRYQKGYGYWRDDFDPDAPLTHQDVITNEQGENPHIKFGGDGSRWGIHHGRFTNHPSRKWDIDCRDPLYRDLKVLQFYGGVWGRTRRRRHNNFTDAQILVDKSTDEILGVLYALDNDYLNEWLRQTLDPSIPNNYDELHAEKEFEVLITTTTYSQEKVKVVGRNYEECVETLKQKDDKFDVGSPWNPFSGMKTTSNAKDAKPIPSSYEEWVSLQEREVA